MDTTGESASALHRHPLTVPIAAQGDIGQRDQDNPAGTIPVPHRQAKFHPPPVDHQGKCRVGCG